jgi:hypothetical protein
LQGETNIKLHTFSSMILAQAEAVEKGISSEMHVARAAKESLEFCLKLLETRTALVQPPSTDDIHLFEGGREN